MKLKAKRRWGIVRDFMVGWTLAFIFLSIVRGVGTIELSSVQFEFWESLLVSFVFGPIFGGISGYSQIILEERLYKRLSLLQLFLFRWIYIIGFLLIIVLLSYLMVTQLFGEAKGILAFATEPGSGAIYFYIICVDLFMVILRQINLLLGENNLWKLLKGEFYTPREEDRIFMFLDLQSSTQHAEKLGHIAYSRMIQDCFIDLGVVVENEAEIYQYVGDEVILTWKLKDGLRNANCMAAYYNFKAQLEQRQKHYMKQYQCIPFFKAGINSGIVTVTEVGKYKKEIAYHGDAINTAARIQGKCNEFGSGVLVSEQLTKHLENTAYQFNKLDTIQLKGKKRDVTVFEVHPK